ncbi:GAF domain-containing sensor histidine kinase [Phormidesmis sp. 146-33]
MSPLTAPEIVLQIERLNSLYHLALALNQAETIQDIYTVALDGIGRTLQTSRVAVLVPDADGIPRYQASIGISDRYKQIVEAYLESLNEPLNDKTVLISNSEEKHGVGLLDELRENEGIKATASFPLRYQGKNLGKIIVYYDAFHEFAPEEIKLAKTIATYIATVITRKQSEIALQQSYQQLADANIELAKVTQLKDEFLTNMSHELRTPLNAILGLSEGLLEESYSGALNDRQKKAITTIKHSGSHLLDLINDILDLAKIESGKIELHLTPVSVHHLCDSSLAIVKQLADKKTVRLVTQISTETNAISIDERRMRQALINLLSNAVKFTPEGGQVTLTVQPDSIHQHICFGVIDTGIGIAPEHITQLFQSFVQIDSRVNRQYTGTGLGLALVRRIVELHDGIVTVESKVGQGSQFTIHLPWRQHDLGQCNPEVDSIRSSKAATAIGF